MEPTVRPHMSIPQLIGIAGILAAVVALSLFVRRAAHDKLQVDGVSGWTATDPDTLYHVRRCARLIDEGSPVAPSDPFLNYPHGAPIPWPPYYTQVAAGLVRSPLFDPLPQGEEGRPAIEQRVASLPLLFGVLTSVLAAVLGLMLAGPVGGLFAGLYHATTAASIAYSRVGNGDHHAWISMLSMAELLLFTAAARNGLRDRGRSLALGTLGGGIAGLMLGSWVASLLYILILQLALGWFLFANRREHRAGLAPFGLAFHLSALAAVLPALLASPWRTSHPWIVVNLSWFHAAHLALGALVFVPLLSPRSRSATYRTLYPGLVAASLALLGVVLFSIDRGPGRGIREGFEWVSRADQFMAGIQESRALVTLTSFDPAEIRRLLGDAIWLLPIAWAWMVWRALRRREEALLPLVLTVSLFAIQAATQARFADALSAPAALAIGVAVARHSGCANSVPGSKRLSASMVAFGLALVPFAIGFAQRNTLIPIWSRWNAVGLEPSPAPPRSVAVRGVLEWLRKNGRPNEPKGAVLANWNLGHAIEWGADHPSVATNFGSYVGFDSYADPGRCLLAEEDSTAEAILLARSARFVLLTSGWPNALPDMIRAAAPERRQRYVEERGERTGRLLPDWFKTLGARLMVAGSRTAEPPPPEDHPDFLRLIHASPESNKRPMLAGHGVVSSPFAWIWEHVPGAQLVAYATPGTPFSVSLTVELGLADVRLSYVKRTTAGADGIARLRIPYSTRTSNGDAWVTGEPRWTLGERDGPLVISEEAVLGGVTLEIP